MITPEQSRAARGWLDWTQDELARRASVSLSTVRDFEKGRRLPIKNNLEAMRLAFEGSGLRFLYTQGGEPLGVQTNGKETAGDPSGGQGVDTRSDR